MFPHINPHSVSVTVSVVSDLHLRTMLTGPHITMTTGGHLKRMTALREFETPATRR